MLAKAMNGPVVLINYEPVGQCIHQTVVNRVTKATGRRTAELIIQWNLNIAEVHLIGHSDGVIIAGHTADFLNGNVGRITGI